MKSSAVFAAAIAAALLAAPAQAVTLKGEVLETQDAKGYTYVRLKTKDGEAWAAIPGMSLKKGSQVTLEADTVMENFESKALKRKFDKVYFASLADPGGKAGANPAANPAAAAFQHQKSAPAPAAPIGKIAKASGADAKTVAEVVDGRAALKGKTVTLRGQVVKASTTAILGKTWIHLQDGSGSAASGTHDIVVTTTDAIAVGDVVSARGTVKTDVDLGSGYKYAVLVEDAKIRK